MFGASEDAYPTTFSLPREGHLLGSDEQMVVAVSDVAALLGGCVSRSRQDQAAPQLLDHSYGVSSAVAPMERSPARRRPGRRRWPPRGGV